MKNNNLLIYILTLGTFGILTTEMGFVGILPMVANHFNVSIAQAGMFVSVFAFGVAIAGLVMPLLFSKINYKKSLLLVLGIFILSNIASIFVQDFNLALLIRLIPAFFHPIFCSFALTLAAEISEPNQAQKAVSKVIMGVSAGMILGVPITSFFATNGSYEIAMAFMALINLISFIALAILMPSIRPKEEISYGGQLSILKSPVVWLSLIGIVLLSSGLSVVYSYVSVYLGSFTHISGNLLTMALFLFGIASIGGNYLGGNLISKSPIKAVLIYPFGVAIVYIILSLVNQSIPPVLIVLLAWGLLYGVGNIVMQYWMISSAPDAPAFSNGLFLSSGNIGITVGTAVGGLILSGLGLDYLVIGGFIFLALNFVSVILRNYFNRSNKHN